MRYLSNSQDSLFPPPRPTPSPLLIYSNKMMRICLMNSITKPFGSVYPRLQTLEWIQLQSCGSVCPIEEEGFIGLSTKAYPTNSSMDEQEVESRMLLCKLSINYMTLPRQSSLLLNDYTLALKLSCSSMSSLIFFNRRQAIHCLTTSHATCSLSPPRYPDISLSGKMYLLSDTEFDDYMKHSIKFWPTAAPGCLPEPRNQDNTYSCSVFTALYCLHGQMFVCGSENPLMGSAQEILDVLCVKDGEHIDEGYPVTIEKVFDYVKNNGVLTEEVYPWTGISKPFELPEANVLRKITMTSDYINTYNQSEILERLQCTPAIGTIVETSGTFGPWFEERDDVFHYSSEEREVLRQYFHDCEHNQEKIKDVEKDFHALTLVGYGKEDDGKDFYYAMDSNGTDYNRGYLKIGYDSIFYGIYLEGIVKEGTPFINPRLQGK